MKEFYKCNITSPVSKVFLVIWVKGQGQSRSGPKKEVKNQNCLKYVKFGIKLKGLTSAILLSHFQKYPKSFSSKVKVIIGQGQYLLKLNIL